jgi:hemerythrin-like domain-containing protein
MRNDFTYLIEKDHEAALHEAEQLEEALSHLTYEGKASFGKNLKRTNTVIKFLDDEVLNHLSREEKVLFPFLEKHFPRLRSALGVLKVEHLEFKKNLSLLHAYIDELTDVPLGPKRAELIDKIRRCGTYLACLLKHHVQTENKGIYRVIAKELKENEKKVLLSKVHSCLLAKKRL